MHSSSSDIFFKIASKLTRAEKKLTLSAVLENVLLVHRNLLEDSSGHLKILLDSVKWDFEEFPINIISPIYFLLYHGENGTVAN